MLTQSLTFLLVTFFAANSFACSCTELNESFKKRIKHNFERHDFILTGKVIAKEVVVHYCKNCTSSGDPVVYTIQIDKLYKGCVTTKLIEIVSSISEVSSGYNFKVGETYLINAFKSDYYSSKYKQIKTPYSTGLCSRNKIFDDLARKHKRILHKLVKS